MAPLVLIPREEVISALSSCACLSEASPPWEDKRGVKSFNTIVAPLLTLVETVLMPAAKMLAMSKPRKPRKARPNGEVRAGRGVA